MSLEGVTDRERLGFVYERPIDPTAGRTKKPKDRPMREDEALPRWVPIDDDIQNVRPREAAL